MGEEDDGLEDEPKDLPELVSSDEEEGPAGGMEEEVEDSDWDD